MPAEPVMATLRQTWSLLEELKVTAALMGGIAMAQWGRLRYTQDVDLLIATADVRLQTLLARLSAAGYRSKGRVPLVRLEDAEFIQLLYEPPHSFVEVQIDLLLADSPFHRQALARRVALPLEALGFEAFVVSCEDLIVLKLLAGRILDRVDVADLLKANRKTLDPGYLMGWIHNFHLEGSLADAWGDAFPSEQPPA
jgi:hypothetical protein